MQLQHFLSWNKANRKHSCKSQLYIVKGEGMIVFTSKLILRAVLKRHTFNVDPLSISSIGTLAPMHSMVICKCLV